jgi:hypothetical protein
MTESTIRPQAIEINTIKKGVAEILVHWDITQIEREDEMSEKTQTMYQYEECRMKWALEGDFETREDVQAYLDANGEEILRFAKPSKVAI